MPKLADRSIILEGQFNMNDPGTHGRARTGPYDGCQFGQPGTPTLGARGLRGMK